MSDRRQVRVRRSPKIGVFLGIGAVVGALVAIVAVNVTPVDPTVTTIQAIGFLILLLAPVGAGVGGVIALLIDRALDRTAKTVEAERIAPVPAPDAEVEGDSAPTPFTPPAAEDRNPAAP